MPLRIFGLTKLFARNRACAELRKRASDYLEGDISEGERERILKHIEECEHCTSFVSTLRSTIAMLRDLLARAMPANLKDRLFHIPKDRGQGQS